MRDVNHDRLNTVMRDVNHDRLNTVMRDASNLANLFYFLGALAKLRKSTVGFIVSVCMSVHPHGTPRLPLNGFS